MVFVTKHFKGDSQKTYLGFSTAAFQLSLLLGVVGGGFVATYISWPVLFLIALAPLLALPVIIKTVPEEETAGSSLNVFGLFLVDAGNWVYILSMTIFPAGFALMYAPLVSTAVRRIPAENSGIAIGFYNLTINMAIPIGIAYSLNLISQDLQFMSAFASPEGTPFASVLLILGVIAAAAFVLYLAVAKILHADDPADAPPVNIH